MGALDTTYSRDVWDAAVELAKSHDWDEIDVCENGGGLIGQWLVVVAYDTDSVGCDPKIIESALDVLTAGGEKEFSPARLEAVLRSSLGPVYDGSKDGTHTVSAVSEAGVRYRFDRSKW